MRLQSGYARAKYVYKGAVNVYDNYGRLNQSIPGISVMPDVRGVIDTDALAVAGRWDAETKRGVEERLLSHPDFGRKVVMDSRRQIGGEPQNMTVFALWFASDQDINEVRKTYGDVLERNPMFMAWEAAGLSVGEAEPSHPTLCAFRSDPPVVLACTQEASDGLYCAAHAPAKKERVKV